MNKLIENVSSIIANHYDLKWNGRSLTLKRWESVGCLSSLFFVSLCGKLVLVDRKDVADEEEGMRLKLPSFHFTERMIQQISSDGHRAWFLVVDGELVHIRDRNVERLMQRVRITVVGPDRHRFEQDLIGPDIEVRQDYLPGRGRTRRDYWKNHLNRKPKLVLEPA